MSGSAKNLIMASQELVDYYDNSGLVIGTCTRVEAEEKNLTTPNAIIFVFDSLARVLVQKRANTKKHYPGVWDTSACGGLEHGENADVAAERELFEEIGIKCDLHLVDTFLNSFASEDGSLMRTRLSSIFVGVSDDNPSHNDEVESVDRYEYEALLEMADSSPEDFVPSFKIELVKAIAGYEKLLAGEL